MMLGHVRTLDRVSAMFEGGFGKNRVETRRRSFRIKINPNLERVVKSRG